MTRRQLSLITSLVIAVGVFVLASAPTALAFYLDEDQNISFQGRVYSQVAIRLEDSIARDSEANVTNPVTKAGQLVQHRTFYSPEIDANLTPYTSWLKGTLLHWLAPDDFRFRLAAWGFYDGIYDYGTSQFDTAQGRLNPNFRNYNRGQCTGGSTPGKACTSSAECGGGRCGPAGAWFLEGPKLREPAGCPENRNACFVDSLDDIFPEAELKEGRDTYAEQARINELYLSYSKGPLFVRLGRQAISWGESDTIALLDQNNPFDITLGLPGIFQDVDEARIPLWTVRASLSLFDTLGPFSSGFVEAYWVPGDIDTTVSPLPILTASPYTARGQDPQFSAGFPNETHQMVLFDHLPEKKFENSRWGFRVQTVFNRAYTLQAWIYTHFPESPVPRHVAPVVIKPGTAGARLAPPSPSCGIFRDQGCSPLYVVETVHELTTVYGLASTFFVEPLDGIVRLEAEYFENEPGFIPQFNLNFGNPNKDPVNQPGTIPKADVLRWEVGFDRFFFFRPLNPTHSFVLVMSQVGQWNISDMSGGDFRYGGQRRIGTDLLFNPDGTARETVPEDFVQLYNVQAFGQITIQTDYMHGRLTPRVSWVQDVRGTYIFHPTLDYRWNDSLLFRLDLAHFGGAYQGPGFFRDRDQLAFRATYQFN